MKKWLKELYNLSKYLGFKYAIKYKLGGEKNKNRSYYKNSN